MRKIILFGDSLTAGYKDGMITDLLTAPIQRQFPENEIINAGIPGDTTRDALQRIENHVLRYSPDLVTVFFGANDSAVYRDVTVEEYEQNLRVMIDKISSDKVLLISPPYISQKLRGEDHPFSILEKYVNVTKNLAKEYQLDYLDLFQEMLRDDSDLWLQNDGLHFSEYGYDQFQELICEKLKNKRS